MPIYQTNVWICEVCGKIYSDTKEVSQYDDPVVARPDFVEWDYIGKHPDEKLACVDCLKKSQ